MKMKNITAAIIICLLLGNIFPMYVSANSIDKESRVKYREEFVYTFEQENRDDFDEIAAEVEKFAVEYMKTIEEEIIWTTNSFDNHQKIKTSFILSTATRTARNQFQDMLAFSEMYQMGCILDEKTAKFAQEAFEEDTIMAAINTIRYDIDNTERGYYYELFKSKNIPVYWDIEKYDNDIYTLEVAVGKYVIHTGDCLSEIAEKFKTTTKKLMEVNKSIKDSDLIYAGDFLIMNSDLSLYGTLI